MSVSTDPRGGRGVVLRTESSAWDANCGSYVSEAVLIGSAVKQGSRVEDVPVQKFGGRKVWYAVQVHNGREKTVVRLLNNKGIEHFLPEYVVRKRYSDRMQTVHLPLFPAYLFANIAYNERCTVLTVPHVVRIVGRGNQPIPIDPVEVESIRKISESRLQVTPWPHLECGRQVYLDEGPLRGVRGTVVREKGSCRVVVSIELLSRAIAVEIDSNWVDPSETSAGDDVPNQVLSRPTSIQAAENSRTNPR